MSPADMFQSEPPQSDNDRLDAPAFHRNHEPIWSALAPYLATARGHVLEAGSGTGQHVVAFARRSPGIVWWPTDHEPRYRASIEAWRAHAGLPNIRPVRRIDLSAPHWGFAPEDSASLHDLTAIFCANVIHIAPWRVAQGLFRDAAGRLGAGGRLFLYGPFMRGGRHTAPSNAAFDAALRAQNPEWGVRDLADVNALAQAGGLAEAQIVQMPANNLVLIFARAS